MMQKSGQSFLARLMMPAQATRQMSTAAQIQARFEKAYVDRTAALKGKATVK